MVLLMRTFRKGLVACKKKKKKKEKKKSKLLPEYAVLKQWESEFSRLINIGKGAKWLPPFAAY